MSILQRNQSSERPSTCPRSHSQLHSRASLVKKVSLPVQCSGPHIAISGGDAIGTALKENVGLIPDKLTRSQARREQTERRSSLSLVKSCRQGNCTAGLPVPVGARTITYSLSCEKLHSRLVHGHLTAQELQSQPDLVIVSSSQNAFPYRFQTLNAK